MTRAKKKVRKPKLLKLFWNGLWNDWDYPSLKYAKRTKKWCEQYIPGQNRSAMRKIKSRKVKPDAFLVLLLDEKKQLEDLGSNLIDIDWLIYKYRCFLRTKSGKK